MADSLQFSKSTPRPFTKETLQPTLGEDEVRLTNKGTPKKRLRANRANKTITSKPKNNKRKFQQFQDMQIADDPENLSPIRKQVKFEEDVSKPGLQDKVNICLKKFGINS